MLLVTLAPWCKQGTTWFDTAVRDLGSVPSSVPERCMRLLLSGGAASGAMLASEWTALRRWAESRPGWRSSGGQSALLIQHASLMA